MDYLYPIGLASTGMFVSYLFYKYTAEIVSFGIDKYVDFKHYIGWYKPIRQRQESSQIKTVRHKGREYRKIGVFLCWDNKTLIDKEWENSNGIEFSLINTNVDLTEQQKQELEELMRHLSGPEGHMVPSGDILRDFASSLPQEFELTFENENFEIFVVSGTEAQEGLEGELVTQVQEA